MVYDAMAESYDYIFPKKEPTFRFLQQHLPKGALLDVACATGEYAIALAKDGNHVKGIDLSKPMIKRARMKAEKAGVAVDFEQGRMEDIRAYEAYDGMYCIGNSLVHLPSEALIGRFFQRLYDALKRTGSLVIQMVNYDRIYRYDIRELPKIQHPKVSLERRYSLYEDKVVFHTKLTTKQDVLKDDVALYPLHSENAVKLLKHVGFKDIRLYDGFSERPYSKHESFALVITAQK